MTIENLLRPLVDASGADIDGEHAADSTVIQVAAGQGESLPDPSLYAVGAAYVTFWDRDFRTYRDAVRAGKAFTVTMTARVGDTLAVDAIPQAIDSGWLVERGLTAADWLELDGYLVGLSRLHGLGVYNVQASQYGARGDGVNDDTEAIQACINDARINAPRNGAIIWLPPGRYMARSLQIPTNKFLYLIGSAFGGSQIYQIPGLENAPNLIETTADFGGQFGFALERLQVVSDQDGGHAIYVDNANMSRFEDVWVVSNGQSLPEDQADEANHKAAIRLHRTIKPALLGVRLSGKSTYGLWIGDRTTVGLSNLLTTNSWVERLNNNNVGTGAGFWEAAVFLDRAGNTNLSNSTLGAIEARTQVKIRDGKSHTFSVVNFESSAAGEIAYDIADARYCRFFRCGMGHPTEMPVAISLDGCQSMEFHGCYVRQEVALVDTDNTRFEACIGQSVTFTGNSADYPKCMRRNFRKVDTDLGLADSFPGDYSNVADLEVIRSGDNAGHYRTPATSKRLHAIGGQSTMVGIGAVPLGAEFIDNGSGHLYYDEASGEIRIKLKDSGGNVFTAVLGDAVP